jgi:hypothetical protein
VLNPKVQQAAEPEQRYPTTLLLSMQPLGFRRESTERDEDADVMVGKKG